MTEPTPIPIRSTTIDLDQFLKLAGVADSGGHAKFLIQSNEIQVNNQPESRRRRTLTLGDTILVANTDLFIVTQFDSPDSGSPSP